MDDYNVKFQNNSKYARKVIWDFGDGIIDTNFDPIHIYMTRGNFDTKLIAFNFCNSDTFLRVISVPDSIYDNNLIKIFPNPANEMVYVKFNFLTSELIDLKILNLFGQVVYKSALTSDLGSLCVIPLRFSPGLYTFLFTGEFGVNAQKIVIY